MSTRLGNAVISYVTYIWKMLWPAKLAVFYHYTALTQGYPPPVVKVIASAVILIGVTALVLTFPASACLLLWCVA
jgi:hypothetical protein